MKRKKARDRLERKGQKGEEIFGRICYNKKTGEKKRMREKEEIAVKIVYQRTAFYYETDQMAIIHHANYIRWFEEARIFAMQQSGIDYAQMEKDGVLIPVLGVTCDYKSMVHFGETVDIEVKMEKYDGVRMEIRYVVRDHDSGEVRTTGSSRHCFITREGRPLSLKRRYPRYHERFAYLLGEETAEG